MTTSDPAQQLAQWLRTESPGQLLPEPPEELDADVVEAVLALRPDRAPAPRVRLDDILEAVQAGPFQGSLDEDSAPPSWPEAAPAPSPYGADAPDPPTVFFEGDDSSPVFDATAFNKALEAHGASAEVTGIETANADALEQWLAARAHGAPPPGVDDEVVEAIYALRPDLAPPPRVDLDDVLASVTEGPFAAGAAPASADGAGPDRGGDVVTLRAAPISGSEREDPTLLPDDHGRPAAPGAAGAADEAGGVVSLAEARRKRGLAWWAALGLGAVLAAAAAVTFVVIPSLEGGYEDAAAPAAELAAERAPAGPMARKSELSDEVAEADPSTTTTTRSLDDAFAAGGAARLDAAPADQRALDTALAREEGELQPVAPRSAAAAAEAEELEALGYLSDGDAAGAGVAPSSGGIAGLLEEPEPETADEPVATKSSSSGYALRGGEAGAEEEARAAELAQRYRAKEQPEASGRASAPAAAAPAEDLEEADDDGVYDSLATTTNTGAASNTGGWGDANTGPPRSTQELRIDAVTSSASPSRASLSQRYPEIARADAAAAEAFANGDVSGAVSALEPLLKHPDANVVMDTAFAAADLLRNAGRTDMALTYVARGLGVAGGSTSQRSRLLALKGVLLETRGDESGARQYYKESLDAMESGY